MAELSFLVAFFAGLVSFLSPCVLPLIPAYLTFLAGTTVKEAYSIKMRSEIFLNSVFFVLGFSIIFSIIGVLLQSVLSNVAYEVQTYLGYVGGIILIIFGLMLMKIIRIDALESEHKLTVKQTKVSYVTSFLFGAAFAVGWTPCVGAVLGGILTLAITNPASALPLMLSYSLGLGIPFLLVGLFASRSAKLIKLLANHLKWLNVVFGIVLVILGILVFTGTLPLIASLFPLENFIPK
ncbi:MAG: cytochrome c biogenesis protein CcdA [Candidatus Micrarchaeota archaeon]|nr:cytochrome c biogenesis protein CcdA [Candidatus Micrarchaeota archaeon]